MIRKKKMIKSKQKSSKKKKRNVRKQQVKRLKLLLWDIVITLVIFGGVIGLLSHFVFSLTTLRGYSMTQTLNNKDVVLVNKVKEVKRFQMIVFRVPGSEKKIVSRVIGLQGEQIAYKDDQLFVDHQEQPERFLATSLIDSHASNVQLTEDFTLEQLTETPYVPKDCFFVLGDNRKYATDSRYFGFINKKDVIGVIEMRVFPFHTMRSF